jgi:uncharacterized lipoprotein YmbA
MIRQMAIALGVVFFLESCASNPPQHIFVLSTPVPSQVGTSSVSDVPRVQLQTVSVPDYMDTTDILTRTGQNEIKPSSTGEWGERLSRGLTHALAATLVGRLPGDLVTLDPSHGRSDRQVRVSVDALDVWPDGRCVLAATWTVFGNDGRTVVVEGRGTFTSSPAGMSALASDTAIVAAMTSAIDKLADSIALAVQSNARPHGP